MNRSDKFAGVVDCILGLLYLGTAVPLILGRVPMNGTHGIRIAKAFASEANWYAINAYGGRWFAAAGVVLLVVGVVAFLRPPRTNRGVLAYVLGPTLGSLLVLVPILAYAARLD